MEMASDTTRRSGNTLSNAADQVKNSAAVAANSVGGAIDKLHDVADYVRENDVEDMGRDVMRAATAYPVASLLVLSAVVIGGSMLVAAMLQDDRPRDASGESRRPMRLASAVSGLGPKGTETLSRIRDAAFGFALDKAVDKVDGMFPGFREHYERG